MRVANSLFFSGLFLALTGMLLLVFGKRQLSNDQLASSFDEKLHSKLEALAQQAAPVLERIAQDDLLEVDLGSFGQGESVYLFNNDKLIYWTSYNIVPEVVSLRSDMPVQYFERWGWKGVIRQWSVVSSAGDTRLVVFIPLTYSPPISNEYLTTWYNSDFLFGSDVNFNEDDSYTFKTDTDLFSYCFGPGYSARNRDALSWGTGLLVFGFVIALVLVCYQMMVQRRGWRNVSLFAMLIVAGFLLSPILDGASYLFDSTIYASSSLNSNLFTLGLIVQVFLLLSVVSTRLLFPGVLRSMARSRLRFAIIIVCAGMMLLALSIHYYYIRDLYDSSQLSLDIYSSLDFNVTRLTVLTYIVINTCTFYFLYNTSFRIWKILSLSRIERIVSLAIASTLFLSIQFNWQITVVVALIWAFVVFVSAARLYRNFLKPGYLSLLYLVTVILLSSVVVSYAIFYLERTQTVSRLKSYASQSLIDEDVFAEYLIDEAVNDIQADPFISYWMISPFASKDVIKTKILRQYIPKYLDKFQLQILQFNQSGVNMDNPGLPDYHTLYKRYATAQNATSFENVFQVNRLRVDFFKRYQTFIEIRRMEQVVGYLVLDFDQKRTFQPNVYPELLIDMRVVAPYNDLNISYAIFQDSQLLYEGGDFNYINELSADMLQQSALYSSGVVLNDHLHVGFSLDNRRLVVSTKGYDPLEAISNFSYLFLFLAAIFGLLILGFSLQFWKRDVSGFALKIQLYMNLAFIIPLVLVTITTISLLNRASVSNIQADYLAKAQALARQVQQPLDNFLMVPAERDALVDQLQNAASIIGTDADLFNVSGGLVASTQPEIYSKGLLSKYIDPTAYNQVIRLSSSSFTTDNSVGNLNFSATYVPIKTPGTGSLIGILRLPFFDYRETLKFQQVEVFSNILNIFSFLFIGLLIISYIVSRRLVNPLNVISGKLNKTSFSGYNEPIAWDSKDEIGRLVEEYNTMIVNLAKSREALARNERELAWREIAKHVAHEIKNPLTPMKLTLQQLKRRLTASSVEGSDRKWIETPVDSLLHQVDVLRDIASSFSAFAKMPIPEMNPFNLSKLVSQTLEIHKNEIKITSEIPKDIIATGDEKLMGRIITNILINAKQASAEDTEVFISMTVNHHIRLEIRDNGPGIPQDIVDKIFLPGFSTKEAGSGIGLSVAKHGIEQSGGQIWVETGDWGTSFFIELPFDK